jgi:hypothetical protein
MGVFSSLVVGGIGMTYYSTNFLTIKENTRGKNITDAAFPPKINTVNDGHHSILRCLRDERLKKNPLLFVRVEEWLSTLVEYSAVKALREYVFLDEAIKILIEYEVVQFEDNYENETAEGILRFTNPAVQRAASIRLEERRSQYKKRG